MISWNKLLKFKSGKIGLFDTKTKRSDLDAPKKHNALLEYIEKANKENNSENLLGGVLIEEPIDSNHWRFCANRIEDTKDLTGWEFLKPELF